MKTLSLKLNKIGYMLMLLGGMNLSVAYAQQTALPDSLAEDFRTMLAKNFSRYRTVNFNWEMNFAHDYTFEQEGSTLERGKKRVLNALNLSTLIPIVKNKRLTLYGSLQYHSYQFEAEAQESENGHSLFSSDGYDYYAGGFGGTYYLTLFNKPLALSASVIADGGQCGFGLVQGRFSAAFIFKHTEQTTITAGVMGMTHFSSWPVMPIFSYWHRFNNPDWSVDITMPSQFYVRYQHRHQRLSAGASMGSKGFYIEPQLAKVPQVCYFSEATLNPELVYEYIINKHFYLVARTGLAMVMKAGLYKENRKGIKVKGEDGKSEIEPLVKMNRNAIPFFNIGISYSLFK